MTKTIPQAKTIFQHSLPALLEEVVSLSKQGWELDPEFPADMIAFRFHVGMIRNATPEQIEKDSKPTRTEIAAKARAAKAVKKVEREAENGE